ELARASSASSRPTAPRWPTSRCGAAVTCGGPSCTTCAIARARRRASRKRSDARRAGPLNVSRPTARSGALGPARVALALCTVAGLAGCASLMSSAASGLAEDLEAAVQNQTDPETVRAGAPAYMLLLDSFIESDPDDAELLSAAANLYAAYGTLFADDPARAARLTERAR